MDIAIVHYNTPDLTAALLRSIQKFTPGADVTIFDNSDRQPFRPDGVQYFDNTHGAIIDFNAVLDRHPDNEPTSANHGSLKHTMSIDWLFDALPDGFILLDSDVLLKRDISGLADSSVAWAGQCTKATWTTGGTHHARLYPFICWLNVPMCRDAGVRYFDEQRTWRLWPGQNWDTGASFLFDCRRQNLPCLEIEWRQYVEHFGNGSWGHRDATQWLNANLQYHKLCRNQ